MPPIHAGKTIAKRFVIRHAAESGGMGAVYRAHDRETDRDVAIKFLLDQEQGPSDRFAQEVKLLATLDHPNIVGYVAHGETDEGASFLVMPWLEGVDLAARLRQGPLTIEETLTLARRIGEALAYMHERSFVHRDLKPSNIFLPNGLVAECQVIDLGVARPSVVDHAITLSGTLIGTPGFIAPEQARGDREIAPAVDIFAFGCVLFECLTGRRLFSGAHLMSVLAKILLEDAPRVQELRPDVPPALDVLIQRMVSKEPTNRPRDGSQLTAWLRELDRLPLEMQAPGAAALGANERRVVSVMVVLLPNRVAVISSPDETRVEADPFHSAAARFGVRAQLLADRMAVALTPERVMGSDQAPVLARFARHVMELFRNAGVAIATGTALAGSSLPAGDAIDRAVSMVRDPRAPRGVRVDEATAAFLTTRFDLVREGGESFVVGERSSVDPARTLLGRPTSCVGRDRELAILEASAAACNAGEGPQVVLVTAPAGAGKSRLRHELARRLASRDQAPLVLECRGDPLHLAANAMVAQVVRRVVGVREGEPGTAVRKAIHTFVSALVPPSDEPRISAFLGELIGAPFDDQDRLFLRAARLDATAMAEQMGRAVQDLVQALCARQPLLLVLEDLQWADAASIKLLDRLLRNATYDRLFVLALARPEVFERFAKLFSNRDVVEIRLPPLTRRACEQLARQVTDIAGDALAQIVDRCEGNAFYLEELIRAMATSGRDGPLAPASGPLDLPATVLAVAQARLERLEPKERRVLRAASVFGDTFWLEGVSALLAEPPTALEPVLQMLVEHEVVAFAENPRLAGVREITFRHMLLRATAYASLTEPDRALGHRLAAQWFEQVGEEPEVVALHWLDAGDRSRAAAAFTRAGEANWARAQADAAVRGAARALATLDPNEEQPEIIMRRVGLLARGLEATRNVDIRDVVTGIEPFLTIEDVARASQADLMRALLAGPVEVVRAKLGEKTASSAFVSVACVLGAISDFDGAKRALAEATELAGDDVQKIRDIRYAATKLAYWCNEGGTALRLLDDTLLPEDPAARFEILLVLAWAVVSVDGREALARGLDFVSRAESIRGLRPTQHGGADALKDPVAQVHCTKAKFFCFYLSSEWPQAAEVGEELIRLSRAAGLRFDECCHIYNTAEVYLRLGERERAHQGLLESYAIAVDIGVTRVQRHHEILLAYLNRDAEQLARIAEAACGVDPWVEVFARYWHGALLQELRAPTARDALESALRMAEALRVRLVVDDARRCLAKLDAPSA